VPAPGLPARTLIARVRRHILDVDLTLDLAGSPVTVLFGPSGAGKTTLLRCLAGLERPEPGSQVQLDDTIWHAPGVNVPTRRRHIGYLFQDHALFPHLSVARNVAYGLHHLPRRDRGARVRETLAAAEAGHLHGRLTRTLSGGEAQRVALARALAPSPRLLLLDEPLSALDTPTRTRLRTDLRRLLLASGIPTIVVTHDRAEALTLGDHIVAIIAGRLHQSGPIHEVFNRPATTDVATAVGMETVLAGQVTAHAGGLTHVRVAQHTLHAAQQDELTPGDSVLVCIRAEDVALELPGPARATSPRNHLPATITAIEPDGPLLRLKLDAGFPLNAYITRPTFEDLDLHPGSRVTAVVKAPAVHLIPHPTGPDSTATSVPDPTPRG
jgi:molybdate transport system ATP-binding protein